MTWHSGTTRIIFALFWSTTSVTPSTGQDGRGSTAAVPRPLTANGARDLTFGTVFPGTPVSVSRRDPGRAGLFEIQGLPGMEIRLDLLLPEALRSPDAKLLALGFATGDAGVARSRGAEDSFVFDPRTPVVSSLSPDGFLVVRLGGTVLPSLQQVSDSYTATVTLTVFYLGT